MNPREHPALWSPDAAPDVVIVEAADPSFAFPLPSSAEPLVASAGTSERNLVYAHGTTRLRLCVRLRPSRVVPAFSIPHEANCALRLAATARLQRMSRGDSVPSNPAAIPTSNQCIRFTRFLALHDALEAGASPRDIAFSLIMPNHRPLTGAAWKGSSERRQVLRLIADARRLVASGYRKVLLHR